MATHEIGILGPATTLDAGVFPDRVGNQISAAATPSVGDVVVPAVIADGGTDEGVKGSFRIPQNYVGTPVIVIRGILDGAPGASDTLGFGFRKRAVADNESADGTLDAEQIASATIGSGGSAHADEDELEETIALTAGDFAAGDSVYFHAYLDASATSYAGNFLLTGLAFRYSDT